MPWILKQQMPLVLQRNKRGAYNVRYNRLLGNKSSFLSRGRSTKQGSCRESAHRFFVPFHACAEGVVYDRHAFLNS